MEYERKGVTIDWQIENVENIRLQKMELFSPVISVDVMDGTKWKLVVHQIFDSYNWFAIKREAEDNGPEEFGLDYQFSVNALQGSSSIRSRTRSCTFKKHQKCPVVFANPPETDICSLFDPNLLESPFRTCNDTISDLSKNICATGSHACPLLQTRHAHPEVDKSPSPDTLMIRCKIWRQQGSISKSGHVFARTRMKTESSIFVGNVENFSDFSVTDRNFLMVDFGRNWSTLKIISSSTGEGLMKVNVVLSKTYQVPQIELIPIENPTGRYFKFRVFILDSCGNKTDTGKLEREFTYISPLTFTLPNVSKEILIKNQFQYLYNDTLSLHCELTFCPGKEYKKVERIEYETDSVAEPKQTDFYNAVDILTKRCGIHCDTKLQTATEAFPAHAAILSAQSPVFEAMFRSNMREIIEKCVHMDNVDAETVKRMLVFLYFDTLEELEWKDSMKLYVSADKYQILSLKQKCTDFLVQSVDLSNCCVLLHLADMHQDNNLKKDIQDYIAKNRPQVLHCDQWRDLEKKLPQLANETLRGILVYE